METCTFTGFGQGGQHQMSSAGSWNTGLQCGQDSDGESEIGGSGLLK